MNFEIFSIPRGQLNNVVLSCMFERDMYGYEIIEDILNRSNGKIEIKQPSLYSSLKRLEQAKLLSSYWTDSDLGGDRHYYSITDLGKKTIISWMMKFVKNNKLGEEDEVSNFLNNEAKINNFENKTEIAQNADKKTEINIEKEEKVEPVKEDTESSIAKSLKGGQLDLFSEIKVPIQEKETKIERASRIAGENEKNKIVQLKSYSENDRKNEYIALKQKNKSFINSFSREASDERVTETIASNLVYSPKEIETERKIEQTNNSVILNKQEENCQKENLNRFRDGSFITNGNDEKIEKTLIDASTQTESLVKDYSDKTDGTFLERDEKLDITPSVKKIEPATLNIESKNNAYSYVKFEEKKLEETKVEIKDNLKPQKNNFFSSYQGLATYFSQQGIAFKEYRK